MMSFSRRIGTVPSMSSRVRWSALVTTQSPSRMRSPGLSSTFNAMTTSWLRAQRCQRRIEFPERQVHGGVALETGAVGAVDRGQAEARRVEGHARDGERARCSLVEDDLEVVAEQQIDAIVAGILHQVVDLL